MDDAQTKGTLPILPRLESAIFAPAPDAEHIRALLRLADNEREELLEVCKAVEGLRLAYCDDDGVSSRDVATLLVKVANKARAAIAKATA